jgi:hypothetical protein
MGVDVAVTMTGLLRTLASRPNFETYHKHVERPLKAELFIVIVGEVAPAIEQRIRDVYRPRGLHVQYPVEELKLHCTPGNPEHTVAAWRKKQVALSRAPAILSCSHPPCRVVQPQAATAESLRKAEFEARTSWYTRVFPQWIGIREAYRMVVTAEGVRGKPYDWLLRTRSDIVYVMDVPIHALERSHAYVPVFGMNPSPAAACTNDHIFICPRHLCRPYFEMLELYESDQCKGSFANASWSAAFDGFGTGAWAPNEPYAIPTIPYGGAAEWNAVLSRYSSGRQCNAIKDDLTTCCGRIRENHPSFTLCWDSQVRTR